MLEAFFNLDWWVGRLRPILDEFIHTAEGNPDSLFWRSIYKPKQTYGATCVTGWIADLFPYLNDAPHRCRNHIFNYTRDGWTIPADKGVHTVRLPFDPEADKGVPTESFPSGLSSVAIKVRSPKGDSFDLDLVAGFLGVEQSADLALLPVIDWSVTEKPPQEPVLI